MTVSAAGNDGRIAGNNRKPANYQTAIRSIIKKEVKALMPLILLQSTPPANLPYLFAAFAVCWLGFFIYAFFVSRRRQELERELREGEPEPGEDGGG